MTDSTQWEEAYRMLWNAAWSPILLEARSWKHESWGSEWVPKGSFTAPHAAILQEDCVCPGSVRHCAHSRQSNVQ